MKKIILFFASAFLLSCSNDDDSNNGNNDQQTKLTKVTEKIFFGDELFLEGSVIYDYHENGFVKSITSLHNENITTNTYDSDNKLIKVNYENNENPSESCFFEYEYENGLIETEISSNGDRTNFTYNSNKQLTESEEIHGSQVKIYNYQYDSNGNLIKIIQDGEMIDSLTYDTKVNPYQYLYPEAVNKIRFTGKNNIIYQKSRSNNMVYEYNAQNFPIKSNNDRNGELGDVSEIREYFYN